jgi:hypothetical protein
MAWNIFLIVIIAIYLIYYGIILMIDALKKSSIKEDEEPIFSFDNFLEESPKEVLSEDYQFETQTAAINMSNDLSPQQESIINKVYDQGIPLNDFRANAKHLANSIQF